MKHIIVPTDFSECANAANEVAVRIAKLQDAELHYLHALDAVQDWAHMPLHSAGHADLAPKAQADLFPEVQQRIGRDDGRRARRAVAEVRRDDELALGAHAHPGHALVPAPDHLASAERELKRAALERGVEDGAVLEAAGVCVRESRVERVRGAGEFNG